MKTQTAIEYLIKGLSEGLDINFNWRTKHIIEQAKEMEKQQIIEARMPKNLFNQIDKQEAINEAKQYYNETFKK